MNKRDYQSFFIGKKITIMGLGLLGRGIGVTKFLADCGADLIVTDLKTAEQLASSITKLKNLKTFKLINWHLGKHRLEDFRHRDLIIKAAGVPLDSLFIAEARKNKIPVEMDASLFAKLAMPLGVKIIGITGTRGKSTVTHLLAEILKSNYELDLNRVSKRHSVGRKILPTLDQKVGHGKIFLGGNVRGLATLPLIQKVKTGDLVVMELDSWQLQGFGDSQISPNLSVFTNLMVDHQNYYGSATLTTNANPMDLYFSDKANIYRWQKAGDIIIAGREIAKKLKITRQNFAQQNLSRQESKLQSISAKDFPTNWKTKLIGEHNRFNVALAIAAARALGIKDSVLKKVVANFTGVPGRLEFIREIKGIKYYNDTTATTPDGVMAALNSFPKYSGRIILIGGGKDKELDYKKYVGVVKKTVKALILFRGTATDKILQKLKVHPVEYEGSLFYRVKNLNFPVLVVGSMKEAMKQAQNQTQTGDLVLLSPGAASFGPPPGGFKNEFDRGDQFVKLVLKL